MGNRSPGASGRGSASNRGDSGRRRHDASQRRADSRRAGGRRGAAQAARRTSARRQRRIGWGRRIGLLGALLLAGAGVVFAGQALRGGDGPGQSTPSASAGSRGTGATSPGAGSTPSPHLPPAPLLDQPAPATSAEQVTLSGQLVEMLPAGGGPYRLHIYVNDRLRREVRINRRELEFTVSGVPLARGANTIRAAIGGPWGETLHSAAVTVERDDEPPDITDLVPGDGSVLYEAAATLSGLTEPGATVTLANRGTGYLASVHAGTDGRFRLPLLLDPGPNEVEISSRDRAGNTASRTIALELGESAAGVTLELSRDSIDLSRLPASISVTALLTDEAGQPLDGVDVVFSISPPGQMTVTYTTVSRNGVALWLNVPLAREGAQAGRGLVTVLATLPDGQEMRESATFTFR